VGGYLVVRRLGQPLPPMPDLTSVEPLTAREIREQAAKCRNASEWQKLGEMYLATGFFPEAEACLRYAATLAPGNASVAFQHAFALERLGKLPEANSQYESAIRLGHPRAADGWYYIGKNHLRLEQEKPAAAAFKQAGNLPGARFELALLEARAGRTEQAENEARRLAEAHPNAYPPAGLLHRLALFRNDESAADIWADQFVRRPRPLPTPLDTEVDWIFGVANQLGQNRLLGEAAADVRAGQLASALGRLLSAQEARWEPKIADRMTEVVLALNRPDEAAPILLETIDRAGPSFERLWQLGKVRPAQALEYWERAARLASGPQARGLWGDLAKRHQQAGNESQARMCQARQELALGVAELEAGKSSEATAALERAVKADPQLAHAWFYLGEAHRAANRKSQARAAFERCLQVNPDHGRARRALRLVNP
jgi:tetratricopeptide (TPR) repeat protein